MGPAVRALEQALAEASGRAEARCVSSGSSALRLALLALDVGPGDEVVLPAYACVSLANAVLALGARVVPAEVSPGTWNLDPDAVKASLSARTRAIVAVHTFGFPATITALRGLGPTVIEDCAHALGPAASGRPYGGRGDVAIASFYATKLVAGGEGGAVLCDDSALAATIEQARDGSDQPASATRLNDKMSDIEAAVIAVQLRRLAEFVARRAAAARRDETLLRPVADALGLVLPDPEADRIWYRYAVEVKPHAESVVRDMLAHGVAAAQPIYDWLPPDTAAACPVAARAYRHLVSLPLYPSLSVAEQDAVVAALNAVLRRHTP